MKKTKFLKILLFFVIIVLFAVNVYATDDAKEGTTEEGWTDFSKAEYKLEKTSYNDVDLVISNVEKTLNHEFYFYITGDNKEPTFTEENHGEELIYDSDKKELHKYHCESYVELNQDLYLWILERKYENGTYEYNFVVRGEKLIRPTYPQYANVFWSTYLSNSDGQILFNVPWSDETHRKINLKIGKIKDNEILKKTQENTNAGLELLLQYAKIAETIYDKQLESSKDANGNSTAHGYSSIYDSVLNLSLENGAYYFMYAELDDENGKYYPVEGITLAQASTYETGGWYLFFLGDESFSWNLSDSIDGTEPSGGTKQDDTVSPIKLPNTGKTVMIGILVGVLAISIGLSTYKCKRYKGIK